MLSGILLIQFRSLTNYPIMLWGVFIYCSKSNWIIGLNLLNYQVPYCAIKHIRCLTTAEVFWKVSIFDIFWKVQIFVIFWKIQTVSKAEISRQVIEDTSVVIITVIIITAIQYNCYYSLLFSAYLVEIE